MTPASDKTDSSQKPSNLRQTTSQSIAPTLLRLPDLDQSITTDANSADQTEQPLVESSSAVETAHVAEALPRPNALSAEVTGLSMQGQPVETDLEEGQDFEPTIKLSEPILHEPISYTDDVETESTVHSQPIASDSISASETGQAADDSSESSGEFSVLGALASRKTLLCIIALIAAYAIFAPRSAEVQPQDIADGEQSTTEAKPLLAGKESVLPKPIVETISEPVLSSPKGSDLSGQQASQAFASPPEAASNVAPTRQPSPSYDSSGIQDVATSERAFLPTSQPPPASNPYVTSGPVGTQAQLASVASETTTPYEQPAETAAMPSFPGAQGSAAGFPPAKPKLQASPTPNAINDLLKYLPPTGAALPGDSTQLVPQQAAEQSQVASLSVPRSADSVTPTPDPVTSARPNEPDFRFALPNSLGQPASANSNASPNTTSAPEARVATPVEAFGNPSFR